MPLHTWEGSAEVVGAAARASPAPFPWLASLPPRLPRLPPSSSFSHCPWSSSRGSQGGAGGCSLYPPLQKRFPETSVELSVSWVHQFKIQNIWSCHCLPGEKLFCYICCVGKPALHSNMLVEKKVIQTSAWRVKPILVSVFWSLTCLSLIYSSDSSVITIILKSCYNLPCESFIILVIGLIVNQLPSSY